MRYHRRRAARAQLVLQHPFLGALLLRLSMREDDQCSSDGSANDDIAEQWQSNVTHIAQQMRSKGRLSAALERALDAKLQPVLPWQELLARFLASHARDDYSFHCISRRGGDALLPSLHIRQNNLVIAIDNSGSISDRELNEFIAEIDGLKSQVRAQVTLLACDVAQSSRMPVDFLRNGSNTKTSKLVRRWRHTIHANIRLGRTRRSRAGCADLFYRRDGRVSRTRTSVSSAVVGNRVWQSAVGYANSVEFVTDANADVQSSKPVIPA